MSAESYSDQELREFVEKLVRLPRSYSLNLEGVFDQLLQAEERGLNALINYIHDCPLVHVRVILGQIEVLAPKANWGCQDWVKRAANQLLAICRGSYSSKERCFALALLGEILTWAYQEKNNQLRHELLALLLDEDAKVRYEAIEFFTHYPYEAAIPYLELLLDDPLDWMSEATIVALNAIPSASAQLALREWEKRQ